VKRLSSLANDFKRWQNRAEEARAIAGQFTDPEARRIMLGIADGYARLAQHAEGNQAHAVQQAHGPLARTPNGSR
jgi:hypothetical protein